MGPFAIAEHTAVDGGTGEGRNDHPALGYESRPESSTLTSIKFWDKLAFVLATSFYPVLTILYVLQLPKMSLTMETV